MKTLVTGFGPFGDVVDNPSARIAKRLAESGAPGHELTVRILPVSFERASAEIKSLLVEGGFDLGLLLGVAGKESEIRIETCGRNRDDARIPDCDDVEARGLILESGPDMITSTVDSEAIRAALTKSRIPARISVDAGSYVCNRVYYTALATIAAHSLPTQCLFIHVPPDSATFETSRKDFGMELTLQTEAIRLILGVFALEQPSDKNRERTVSPALG